MENRELLKKAKEIEPTIRIGKSGLSEATIAEIKKQLKTRKLVKIKMLRNFIHDKAKGETAERIAELAQAELVERKGFILTLYKNGNIRR